MNEIMNKRIIIAAGGTGGHIYPAVSIIEYLKDNYPETEILFIGTGSRMERSFVEGLEIKFKAIKASGFSASQSFMKKILICLKFFVNLVSGLFSSILTMCRFKPDFVLGMGGYICAPVFIAAIILHKKIALHEQNFIPGRLNKYFVRFSKYIFLSFNDSGKFFKCRNNKKSCQKIYSGNPIRKSVRNFYKLKPEHEKWGLEKGRKTIVAFGGSLGAERINSTVLSLYDLLRYNEDLQFLLISGSRFASNLEKALLEKCHTGDKLLFRIYPFVKEMEQIYRIADLVISRAGATTVAELDFTKIPSILIPYPEAIDNHQYYNAEYLMKKNRAVLVSDRDLSTEILLNEVRGLLARSSAGKDFFKENFNLNIENLNAEEIISKRILGIIKD